MENYFLQLLQNVLDVNIGCHLLDEMPLVVHNVGLGAFNHQPVYAFHPLVDNC